MNTEPDADGPHRNKFGRTRSVNTSQDKMFTAKTIHGPRPASNSVCRKQKKEYLFHSPKRGKRSGFLKSKVLIAAHHQNWKSPEVSRGRELSHQRITDKTKAKSEIRAQLVSIFEKARTNFNT